MLRFLFLCRDRKTAETDFHAVANCFGYTLLQQLLSHTENAQEYMLELGTVLVHIFDKQTSKLKPNVIIESLI